MSRKHWGTSIIEQHSFNYVPEQDRYGTVFSQTQFWFMINATIITALTGSIGPTMGLNLGWSLIAIVIGNLIGTSFQAFHGTQGPHMGLPQMIQSRVQFGSRGALIPIVAAAIIQLGFGIFNLQTATQLLGTSTVDSPILFQIILGSIAILTAIVGFRIIVNIEKIASYFMFANLILLTIAMFIVLPVGDLLFKGSYNNVAFIAQIAGSASYQIALAPMISDMTRYLPTKIGNKAVIVSVFGGTFVSASWIGALGAVVTTAYPGMNAVAGLTELGNKFGFGLGTITIVIAVIVTLATFTQGMYSGSITVLSGIEAFKPLKPTASIRAITLGIAGIIIIALSILMPDDVLNRFNVFLTLLGYLLIPWTAINLTDFYLVRKGQYSISSILRQDGGIYGYWNINGLLSYLLGLLVMIPFVNTPFYVSPVAKALGNTDISFVAGFIISGIGYLILSRNLDMAAEISLIQSDPLCTEEFGNNRSNLKNKAGDFNV